MNSYFSRTRLILSVLATLAPVLAFAAFLLYAGNHGGWASLVILVAAVLFLAWPLESPSGEPRSKAERWRALFGVFPMALVMYWVVEFPEFQRMMERLRLEESLWDWRPITAGAIACAGSAMARFGSARRLSDRQIYEFFAKERRGSQAG